MAIKLTSTRRDIHFIKCLVYGESGIGKTVLCSTAPRPIILSAEEGLLSLANQDIDVIEVKSLKDVEEAIKFVKKSEEYDTVCLDSLSELAETLLAEFKNEEKDPRKAYLRMGEELTVLMRELRGLKKHVVVTAKQGTVKDELLGRITYAPSAPGQAFAASIPYFLDLMFCMRAKKANKELIRYLQTQPDIQYMAKDRSGCLKDMEEPNLTLIFNKIVKGK